MAEVSDDRRVLLKRRRRKILLLLGVLFLLLFAFGYLAITFALSLSEPMKWQPEDEKRLAVTAFHYSSQGIILNVRAPAGIDKVLRQRERSGLSFSSRSDSHYPITFWAIQQPQVGQLKLLVEYKFSPGREWLLALKSQDGYWTSMSPYFPDKPDVSDGEWQRLMASATKITPLKQE